MPGFLVWLAIDLILMVASHFIAKRLPVGKTDPGSIDPPSADPTRPIPVVWGTAKVQPNVFWFGSPTSLEFTKKGQHAGYTYYAPMAMGICWGPIDALVDIIFDNRRAMSLQPLQPPAGPALGFAGLGYMILGTVGTILPVAPALPRTLPGTGLGENLFLEASQLFGGAEKEGGIRGLVGFYFGTEAQIIDPYLDSMTRTPHIGVTRTESDHKRLCYAVFKHGGSDRLNFGWGTTPNIKPVHFVVRRCPNGCNGGGTATINGFDANPAEIIYEILTDTWWGLKVAAGDIDLASFQACAATLYTEGLGISLVASSAPPGTDTIQEVLRYIDGAVYTDPVTGKIAMNLVRKDYVEANLPVINSSNGHSFEFSRPTYRELATGVKLKFTNRLRSYQEDVADWQNQATLEASAEESIQEIEMVGITDPAIAQKMAFRVGKAITMPFARCQFKTTRTAFNWVKAKPFMLQVPEESIGPIVMRVMEINYGSMESGEITISAIEDVFFTGIAAGGVYAPPVIGIDTPASTSGDVIPFVIETVTLTSTQGTLDADINDPNSRITAIEVRTTTGTGTPTAWVTWASPYIKTVTRLTDADINIQYRITYTGPDGATDFLIDGAIIDRLGTGYAPVLDIQLTESNWQSVTYTVTSTTPEGMPVTIYYALGDDPFVLTVANGGTITVLRSTGASDDRLLRIKSVANNGQYEIRSVLVDWDTTPEIVSVTEAVPIWSGNVQTGWRVRGTVDDDTRSLMVVVSGSLTATTTDVGPTINAVKTTGTGAWDQQVYSNASVTGGAYASARAYDAYVMFGLNTDPTTDASYSSIDYAWYTSTTGGLLIYENGTNPVTGLTWVPGDLLEVIYDNATVKYYKNGSLVRTVAVSAGLVFYFDSSFYTAGNIGQIRDIHFGATAGTSTILTSALTASAGITLTGTGSRIIQTNATTYWEDTSVVKTFDVALTQAVGQSGQLILTPREFHNIGDGGTVGQPYSLTVSRPAITSAFIFPLLTTVREIQLSANPSTATIYYRYWYGVATPPAFSVYPPPEPPLTVDVEATYATLEFYSITASGAQEEIRRIVIDQNDQPGITSHTLVADGTVTGGDTNALLALGFDDDVVNWTAWARRGSWPTSQSSGDPNTWIPDDIYLRYGPHGSVETTSINWRASGSSATWYVIVRAYDKHGSYDEWYGTFVTSVAQAGALSSVVGFRNTESALGYHDITWTNNSVVETGNHTVTIKEDGVTLVSSRDPRWEHNTSSNVTANFGGYHIRRDLATAGDPGAVYLEYSYSVELWKTSPSALVDTYSAAIAGWYPGVGGGGPPPAPPTEVTSTPVTTSLATGVRATWTNGSAVWPSHIYWETSTTVGGTYTLALEVNLAAATTTHDFNTTGVWARCKVRYYNDAGNGTYSAISNASTAVYVPTEIPASTNAAGASSNRAKIQWTNTSAVWGIEVEFYVKTSGGGVWTYDRTVFAVAGDVATAYETFTFGWQVKGRTRYYNGVGNGDWSGYSNVVLMH